MQPRSVPLSSIQILRAVAAGTVLLGHCFHEAGYIAEHTGREPFTATVYLDWRFGVDIFFVISGFIMIYTTADRFGAPGAGKVFLTRRFLRIAPLYWLMTLGIVAVAVIAPSFLNVPIEGWRTTITSLLFIPDFRGNGEIRPILAAGWTLNYEMFFYAVFACCLLLPLRRGVLALIGFFIAFTVLGSVVTLPTTALAVWSDPIILEFAFGVLIGLACRAHWRLSALTAISLAIFAFGLELALDYWSIIPMLPRFIWGGIPAAMLVAAAAWGPLLPETRLIAVLVALGDASYSLYLTHPFAIRPMRNIWLALDGGKLPLPLYMLACFAVATVASLIVYHLVEKKMTDWLQGSRRRRLQQQSKQAGKADLATSPSGDTLASRLTTDLRSLGGEDLPHSVGDIEYAADDVHGGVTA